MHLFLGQDWPDVVLRGDVVPQSLQTHVPFDWLARIPIHAVGVVLGYSIVPQLLLILHIEGMIVSIDAVGIPSVHKVLVGLAARMSILGCYFRLFSELLIDLRQMFRIAVLRRDVSDHVFLSAATVGNALFIRKQVLLVQMVSHLTRINVVVPVDIWSDKLASSRHEPLLMDSLWRLVVYLVVALNVLFPMQGRSRDVLIKSLVGIVSG